ncbi:hypothetical protein [Blautia sp.]
MGFIDWHGTKEDHFDNVLEYAKDRKREEIRAQEEKIILKWMGDRLGDSRYGQIKSTDCVRLLAREYIALDQLYMDMIRSVNSGNIKFDPVQLWKDLWTATIEAVIEYAGIQDQKKVALMSVFSDKVFRLNSLTSVERHLQEKKKSRRYTKYFRECFFLESGQPMQFWRWIYKLRRGNYRKTESLLSGYQRSLLLMAFYLYLSAEESGKWILQMEQQVNVLTDLQKLFSENAYYESDDKKLMNPLYAKSNSVVFEEVLQSMKVLLFHFVNKSRDKEGEMRMVEELYVAIDEKRIQAEQINSILPAQVINQIREGKLPEFPKPDVQGLDSEEKLFYLNHTVLYQGKEKDDEIDFKSFKGTLYFTDRKIMFRGNGSLDLYYDKIDRIVEYDILPEILEVISNGKSNFFQVPDIEIAYQGLKLIANRGRGEAVPEENIPFTYEELINKADLKACAFAFDYAMAGDMPEELREQLREINCKLLGLQKTIDRYPERKEEVYQFLVYYVPEAVRVVTSYQRYQHVGLDEKKVLNVYEKIKAAIKTLDGALVQKIADIYQFETMDTVARAETLREILGQDGFVESAYEMFNRR